MKIKKIKRSGVIDLRKIVLSIRDVPDHVVRIMATISLCWQIWTENNEVRRRLRSGRSRCTTDRVDRDFRLTTLRIVSPRRKKLQVDWEIYLNNKSLFDLDERKHRLSISLIQQLYVYL